jgi:hypothetical protein
MHMSAPVQETPTFIVFLNKKGGVGKTSLSSTLKEALLLDGKGVSYRTVDTQGTWVTEETTEQVQAGYYPYRIIDTKGNFDVYGEGISQAQQWADWADVVVVPTMCSYNVNWSSTAQTIELVKNTWAASEVAAAKVGETPRRRLLVIVQNDYEIRPARKMTDELMERYPDDLRLIVRGARSLQEGVSPFLPRFKPNVGDAQVRDAMTTLARICERFHAGDDETVFYQLAAISNHMAFSTRKGVTA